MRVFFALVPDDGLRASLGQRASELAQRIGGGPVRADNLHLTLAFVGDVDAARVERLRSIVSTLPRARFVLILDRLGEWRHAAVAWIAPCGLPPELTRLRARIDEALAQAGFAPETRPFRPHVTLVRRQVRALDESSCPPLTWEVSRLALMQSEREAGVLNYRELAGVTLAG